jgi:hypothetical protein
MRSLGLDVELISSASEELGDMAEIPVSTSFLDAVIADDEVNIDTVLDEISASLLNLNLDFGLDDGVPSLVDINEDESAFALIDSAEEE